MCRPSGGRGGRKKAENRAAWAVQDGNVHLLGLSVVRIPGAPGNRSLVGWRYFLVVSSRANSVIR